MIFFGGGGGALALDDGACDPLLFQKWGIFPTTNKTLKGHSYHLIFHINPFVTRPGDLRDLGRPFRYEARRSPGLIA